MPEPPRPPRSGSTGHRRYPRTLRVNELLREVIAEALEEIDDDRLKLLTVTAVESTADLRQAKVFFSSMDEHAELALHELRVKLQSAIGAEVRLKRTPQLSFVVDPAVTSGARVDEILRRLDDDEPGS